MRIGIDARLYGKENAGLGRYISELLTHLGTIDKKNEYYVFVRNKYKDKLLLPRNFRIIEFDHRHYSISEQLFFPPLLNKLDLDLVHFPHFNVPVLYNRNFIVTIHDMLMHFYPSKESTSLPYFKYLIKQLFYRIIFRNAVIRSKSIIVPSKFIKKQLIDYYKIKPDKIIPIYEGISSSVSSQKNNYQKSKKTLLYAGNAYPHKNVVSLIESLAYLEKDYKLTLVVPRDIFIDKISTLVKDSKSFDRITILSGISDTQLKSLYNKSEIFVYPSLMEGFGLQGVECLSNKTILCASDIPIFRELYDGCAVFFDPRSPKDIADKIRNCANMTNNQRKIFFDNFEKKRSLFSWEKMSQSTLEIYEDCHSLR